MGGNVPAAFQPINVIFGKDEEPWAEQYKFGWTIIGRVSKDEQRTQNSASVNRVTVERETLLDRSKETSRPPSFEKVINTKDVTSPKQVREMMELDYSEIHHSRKIRGTEQVESIEDKRLREMLTMGLHNNTYGNWEAPLPFKSDDLSLPNNKGHCLRRLLSLKRRLLNNSKLKEDYLAFMKKTLDNGHTSRVSVDQLSTKGQSMAPSPLPRIPTKKTGPDPSRI